MVNVFEALPSLPLDLSFVLVLLVLVFCVFSVFFKKATKLRARFARAPVPSIYIYADFPPGCLKELENKKIPCLRSLTQ